MEERGSRSSDSLWKLQEAGREGPEDHRWRLDEVGDLVQEVAARGGGDGPAGRGGTGLIRGEQR